MIQLLSNLNLLKKSNICPIYKKSEKNLVKLINLIKLEKLIFECLFNFLQDSKLLSDHQLGFQPNDSCTKQLLSIVHDIHVFDAGTSLETCAVFLDMSNKFDKVYHGGLPCRSNRSIRVSNKISGELFK